MKFTTKLVTIAVFAGIVIWFCNAAGQWALQQRQATEIRYQEAMDILRGQ